MKKALLMNILYKPNIGGIENSIFEISKILIRKGYEVDILCSNKNNEDGNSLEPMGAINGSKIYRYNYDHSKLSFFINILNSRKALKDLIKDNRYSLVISRSYFLVIIGAASGLKNIKYVPPEVTYYSKKGSKSKIPIREYSSTSTKFLLQWLALMTSKKVYVFSESMFNQVKQISLNFILPTIVSPGINLDRFSSPDLKEKEKLKSLYKIPHDKNIILALGRFSEIKQFDLAILTMKLLSDEYLLVLVGSGPELQNYHNIISKNKLENKVLLFDSTSNPEHFYKSADVFLMTSRYESFGQTILEACVSGLHIISFDRKSGVNTNVESMLADCEGVSLVSEQSITALANAIRKTFKENKNLHSVFSDNQKILSQRYSWDNFVSSLERC